MREGDDIVRKLAQRVAVTAGLVLAAGTLQLSTSTSAQATPAQCTSYLKSYGYNVGPKVKQACQAAANDWWENTNVLGGPCQLALTTLGVNYDRATFACEYH